MNAAASGGFEVVVERTLIARERTSGKEKTIYLAIGRPSWSIQGEEASCTVLVKGLYYDKPQDLRSIDPLSALRLAIQYVDKLIGDADKELQFFWPDGEPFETE